MYLADVYTVLPCNLAGLPGSVSVPCGFTGAGGRPWACRFWGKPFDEHTLFRVGVPYSRTQVNLMHKEPALC